MKRKLRAASMLGTIAGNLVIDFVRWRLDASYRMRYIAQYQAWRMSDRMRIDELDAGRASLENTTAAAPPFAGLRDTRMYRIAERRFARLVPHPDYDEIWIEDAHEMRKQRP